ncbi:hypothetical protein BSPWISOXPB_4443 [uncultured Gammaproteobacteria bacterium]|nr:hypothetical protein BSPWISOXPB_4443 [uncultured Gammaproteobacteria bacterium]
MAGAANDTYCWLKHGVYEQCDDALFTNIGLEVEKNKTDNDTFFDAVDTNGRRDFYTQRKPLHDKTD